MRVVNTERSDTLQCVEQFLETELEQWQCEQQQSQQQQLCSCVLRIFIYIMVTTEDILEAYFNCRKNKRYKKAALTFELNYQKQCVQLVREINNRKYKIGSSNTFIVHKPKDREIFAADFRDRVVHHWLILRLEPLFEKTFIEDTYNCRKGKGTQYGVNRLAQKIEEISENYTKECWIGKFDMLGFFMSIHKPTLWKNLKKFIKDNYTNEIDKKDVLYITKKVVLHCPEENCIKYSKAEEWDSISENKSLFTCGKEYGLPIGNITSQMFANFYLNPFDLEMIKIFGNGYGRYVDDFFLISADKNKILKHINYIKDFLKNNFQVTLHPDKIYILECHKGVKFIGSVIKPHRKYTGNRTVKNFKECIKDINQHHDYSIEKVLPRINSYLGFMIHTSSFNIRKRILISMDSYWKKLFKVTKSFSKVIPKDNKHKNLINLLKNGLNI